MLTSYTFELERLLLMVEPKLFEQVTAAKDLTNQEMALLIKKFSNVNDELKQIFDLADQELEAQEQINLANLKNNVANIRNEIDVILEALQFQDRVSQILGLVQTNLAGLRETLEQIQQQGPNRHKKMLQVEETVKRIETQYETVKHRAKFKQPADDIIFF